MLIQGRLERTESNLAHLKWESMNMRTDEHIKIRTLAYNDHPKRKNAKQNLNIEGITSKKLKMRAT